jgi:hypothetical protein
MKRLVLVAVLVLMAGAAQAQTVLNPRSVEFDPSFDHAVVTSYVIGYFLPGATEPVQTADLGKPEADPATGKCTVQINTQPLGFATGYVARVRAVAGDVIGEWSDLSNPFNRVPGKPGGPVVK